MRQQRERRENLYRPARTTIGNYRLLGSRNPDLVGLRRSASRANLYRRGVRNFNPARGHFPHHLIHSVRFKFLTMY